MFTDAYYRMGMFEKAFLEVGKTDPAPYWMSVLDASYKGPYPTSWCGGFCLWALHENGLALDVKWTIGLGFLLVKPHALDATANPEIGDIAYFHAAQHHALVARVDGSSVILINGNGETKQRSGIVTVSRVAFSKVAAFYSIGSFIEQAQKDTP
jgi:hypothetical protein